MSNEMKDWMNDTVQENKKLCELYPFLDCDRTYEFTWLDSVPIGWQESFLSMCQKLDPFKEDFKILEIKEKYGQLRVYFWTDDEVDEYGEIYNQVEEIINSYCNSTTTICLACGKEKSKKKYLCEDCMRKVAL